jgi:enediyne biosynthesis protein E4
VDVVVTAVNGPAKLFRNITPGESHWLAVRLRGRHANRQGLGAKVRVRLPDGRELHNHATTAVGYASSSEPLVRFGLGANRVVVVVEVQWPGGGTQTIANVAPDRIVDIVEEAAKP